MRLLIVAGLLVFSAGSVFAAYVVELDAGDRMTVDSYWPEGDRMHLMRGGVDLSVPRSRIRGMREVPLGAEAGVRPATSTAPPAAAVPGDYRSRKELERQRIRIERHLVRAHMEASEAQARGDGRTARRLEKEIARTQKRRQDVKRALDTP